MKGKKVLGMLLATVLSVTALAGCGSDNSDTGEQNAPAAEEAGDAVEDDDAAGEVSEASRDAVELEYWTWFPSVEQYAETIEAFEAANPDIKINLTVLESKAFQEKVPLALATEEEIDIIGVQPSAFATEVQDYLADLDPLMSENEGDDWSSRYSELGLSQGNQLTGDETKLLVLTNSGSMIGFYNAALLEEIGCEVPETIEEYKEVADKLYEVYPDKLAGVFAGKEAWIADEMMLTILGQSGDYYNQWRYEDAPVNSDEFSKALEGMQKYFEEGIFSQDIMDLDYAAAMESFVNGEALIYYMGSWEAHLLSEELRNANGMDLEDVGAMALPIVEAGGELTVRSYIDSGIGIVDSSKKKEAAAKFVAFVTLQEGADIFGKQLTGTSAKVDFSVDEALFTTEAAKDGWDTIVELLATATADRNNVSGYSDIEGAIVQSVINGSLSVEEALEEMEAEWTSGKY